jgi:hypothetical protein
VLDRWYDSVAEPNPVMEPVDDTKLSSEIFRILIVSVCEMEKVKLPSLGIVVLQAIKMAPAPMYQEGKFVLLLAAGY